MFVCGRRLLLQREGPHIPAHMAEGTLLDLSWPVAASLLAVGLGGWIFWRLRRARPTEPRCIVRRAPLDAEIKEAVISRMLDGDNDFMQWAWSFFAENPAWTLYRCDLDGRAAGVFLSLDQGRGEAFLNGLRTDDTIRRRGVATRIIRWMDADLAASGFKRIRMATTSANTPMLTLCKEKLGLAVIPFRMCQCDCRSEGPIDRATCVTPTAAELPAWLDALQAFVEQSDYYKLSQGIIQDGPGQFREATRAELESRLAEKLVYVLGSREKIEALAIMGNSPLGPNPMVAFLAGNATALPALMDELRALIPANHPKGPVEVFGYLPIGCAAFALSESKAVLPSGEHWYCPRETLQLVMQWEAGTLGGAR